MVCHGSDYRRTGNVRLCHVHMRNLEMHGTIRAIMDLIVMMRASLDVAMGSSGRIHQQVDGLSL